VRFAAVLFDLDGTLLDTLADIGGSMNSVLEDLGLPIHPLDCYRRFVGDGVVMLARRALPTDRRDEDTVAEAVARMRAIYGTRSRQRTTIYDGITELLDGLEARGVAKAVLSNKPHELTVSLVAEMLGRWSFAPVVGEREGVARKPDPHSAREIAGALGVVPERILYLGDTPTDMQTAKAAGMAPVGAGWGFRDGDELRQAGAWQVVSRPPALLDLL